MSRNHTPYFKIYNAHMYCASIACIRPNESDKKKILLTMLVHIENFLQGLKAIIMYL